MEERKTKIITVYYRPIEIDVSILRGLWDDLEHRFDYVRANNGNHRNT